MNTQAKRLIPAEVNSQRRPRVGAKRFFTVARLPAFTAGTLAVITLLLIATPVGSRMIELLDFNRQIDTNAQQMISEGRQTFRFDTFGDEAFWGDLLKLHLDRKSTRLNSSHSQISYA